MVAGIEHSLAVENLHYEGISFPLCSLWLAQLGLVSDDCLLLCLSVVVNTLAQFLRAYRCCPRINVGFWCRDECHRAI